MDGKIVVPEGMLKAAMDATIPQAHFNGERESVRRSVEGALRWLSENPIVPTDEQRAQLARDVPYEDSGNGRIFARVAVEWQRRIFLAPEPPTIEWYIDNEWREGDGLPGPSYRRKYGVEP